MAGALSGVTVLEVADYITGPYAGQLLADMGAEVVKIEKLPSGDPFRGFGRDAWKTNYDIGFIALNRNKKSMTLNLASPEGQDIFRQLAKDVTVIIENHRPGQMKRWGLDYESISATNPGVVYCSITGFGQDGPYRDLPGYDTLGVAMGGLLSLLTEMERPSHRTSRSPTTSLAFSGRMGSSARCTHAPRRASASTSTRRCCKPSCRSCRARPHAT